MHRNLVCVDVIMADVGEKLTHWTCDTSLHFALPRRLEQLFQRVLALGVCCRHVCSNLVGFSMRGGENNRCTHSTPQRRLART